MANPELRAKFGRAGRRRAEEKFSWSAIAAETKALYASLLKKQVNPTTAKLLARVRPFGDLLP
jgi:hypothetical protein